MQAHGHFVEGKPGSPSLIVLHEYWGLNEHISDVANRFAAEGFRVDALETRLTSAKFHRCVAHHAFFNDTQPEAYSPADAQLAWARTLAFLKEVLA